MAKGKAEKGRGEFKPALDSLINAQIGRRVRVGLVDGTVLEGKLRAVARYDFWLTANSPKRELIILKGNVLWVEVLEEQ